MHTQIGPWSLVLGLTCCANEGLEECFPIVSSQSVFALASTGWLINGSPPKQLFSPSVHLCLVVRGLCICLQLLPLLPAHRPAHRVGFFFFIFHHLIGGNLLSDDYIHPCMEIMAYLRSKFRLSPSITAHTRYICIYLYLNLDLVPLFPMNDLIQEYFRLLLVGMNSFEHRNVSESENCKKKKDNNNNFPKLQHMKYGPSEPGLNTPLCR